MNFPEIAKELNEPFEYLDIEWRPQQVGDSNGRYWAILLAYVTNRAIMERLDKVFGIIGWANEFEFMPDGGIVCGISVNTADGWVTKYDGADKTNIEATKGGLSNAMKRAAVQWGIGRYLYNLDTTIVNCDTKKPLHGDFLTTYYQKDKVRLYYQRPQLPDWALPGEDK